MRSQIIQRDSKLIGDELIEKFISQDKKSYEILFEIEDKYNKLQNQLFNFYHKNSKLKDDQIKKLKNDFDILSVQRNLKILGIFVRLYKRDNKSNYLKFLPYTWTLIEKRLQNPALKNLKLLFHKHLSIKKPKKLNKI